MTRRPIAVFVATVCVFLTACSGAAMRREPPTAVTTAPDPAVLFTQALAAQESGNAERAHALWRQLIAAAPTNGAAHTNLGILLRQTGNIDEAIHEYEAAITLDPRDARAYHNMGVAYRLQGAWQDAERAYRRAIELRPDQMDSHYNLGILYELFLNRPEEALTQYRAVLSHGGSDADTVAPWVRALERRLAPASDAPTPETK